MKVILCQEPGCEAKYIVDNKDIESVVAAFIQDSDPGDRLTLELVEMTPDEIAALPEFKGC